MIGQNGIAPRAAQGIRISRLERRALDDVALRAGCSLLDPYTCCEPCWHQWVCARLMEHLRGERFWEELDRGDYGLLRQGWHANLELVEAVVTRMATGSDSIGVLTWATATEQPLDDVVAVLRTVDGNVRRLPRYRWLSAAPPCGRA